MPPWFGVVSSAMAGRGIAVQTSNAAHDAIVTQVDRSARIPPPRWPQCPASGTSHLQLIMTVKTEASSIFPCGVYTRQVLQNGRLRSDPACDTTPNGCDCRYFQCTNWSVKLTYLGPPRARFRAQPPSPVRR